MTEHEINAYAQAIEKWDTPYLRYRYALALFETGAVGMAIHNTRQCKTMLGSNARSWAKGPCRGVFELAAKCFIERGWLDRAEGECTVGLTSNPALYELWNVRAKINQAKSQRDAKIYVQERSVRCPIS